MRGSSPISRSQPPPRGAFVEPPWDLGLDADKVIARIPPSATIAGMFFLALSEAARARGLTLPLPSERTLKFGFYSVAEFARLLVYAAPRFYPGRSLRQSLRTIGHSAPRAFQTSTLGKVTLGSAHDVQTAVTAIAKTYEHNIRPSRCEVLSSTSSSMTLRLERVYHFLDSHHVGVFEGTLAHVGATGTVRIAPRGETAADLLLEW